jgi:hypothetical protein
VAGVSPAAALACADEKISTALYHIKDLHGEAVCYLMSVFPGNVFLWILEVYQQWKKKKK